jgi:hypothetical protein
MIVLGTLLAAASFCFAQGTIENKNRSKEGSNQADECVVRQRDVHAVLRTVSRSRRCRERPRGAGHEITANEPDATGQEACWQVSANTVAGVLKFGSGGGTNPAHGSADMPIWGPLFLSLDKYHDSVVPQRISNIVTYIETLQAK